MNHTADVVNGHRIHQLALWCVLLETVKAEWSFPGTSILAVVLIHDFKNMLSWNDIHEGILFGIVSP